MRKILALGLMLAPFAGAVAPKVDYATYTIISAASTGSGYFWNTPDKDGEAVTAGAPSRDALAIAAKCGDIRREGDFISDGDLLRCFGKRGWQLITIDVDVTNNVRTKSFYFQRAVE